MTTPDRPDDGRHRSNGDGVIRTDFDWSSKAPSTAVVKAVAIASDREPTAIEPLYRAVDPDALDALVRSNGTDSEGADATVSFSFAGHHVTVHGDGTLVVSPGSRR